VSGGDSSEHFVPGQRIGDYELVTRLAAGGMAELFVARRGGLQGFEKFVVLKRILPQLSGNADFVEMFLQEARVAATLEHPNIVPVFDFGQAGGDYFFVMPYVHGRDLLAVLRASHQLQRRMPTGLAIRTAIAVASGLHYAHEHRNFDGEPLHIVHRDVSPANVLVTYGGHVRVLDFGIAKAAARTNVTRVGVRKGKAAYMSPEQCRGEKLDRRCDVWAIGVVLWEMTMMRRLFRGGNDLSLMNRITTMPVEAPSATDPTYPPALEAIVMRCLQREREGRYPTALALAQDLEAFARDQALDTSAEAYGQFLLEVLGPPTYPWSTTSAGRPVARGMDGSPAAGSAETFVSPSTDQGPGSELITRTDLGGRPGSGVGRSLGWLAAGTAAGLVAVATTWALAGHAESPAPASPPAAVAADVEALLPLVNQPSPALALPYADRHALLDAIAADPDVAGRIDARLNLGLDLLQAEQAETPCHAYSDALDEIARIDARSLADTVRDAPVPSRGRGCETLAAQRQAVLGRLGLGP
jgi:serine/threonine protein kinase